MLLYPLKMRLVFLESGQVVTQQGIDSDTIPEEVLKKELNLRLFKTVEEAKAGKVNMYKPPVKDLIPNEDK